MHRFYAPPEVCAPDTIELEGQEAHHALHVLRSRPGDTVTLLDGVGHGSYVPSRSSHREASTPSGGGGAPNDGSSCVPVTLYQAIPKGKTLDHIIHKATELGVFHIVPLISERAISRPGEEGASRKTEKWHLTAVEAIKQCGQTWLPRVDAPRSFTEVLEAGNRLNWN
jgi:16S rRNA (uracil1498-N3)-methyltransferase